MKKRHWLAINQNGITKVRKTKPYLDWNEIAVAIDLDIPDELFERPVIQAKLRIEDVPNQVFDPELVINTAESVAQQSGAKIEFSVVHQSEEEEEVDK